MSDAPPSSPAPALTWWQKAWANRKAIASAIGVVLMLVTPFLPAQYQPLARGGQQVLEHVAGDGSSSSSSSSSSTSPAASCRDGQVQSLPHFCRCVAGEWHDYFDADAGCPED